MDDNPVDAELACEASAGGKYHSKIHHELNGERSLAYLRRGRTHGDAEKPDLVLLDLNLPGKSGREVLADLKGDSRLRTIPVVVFSTSQSPKDVLECYEAGANCYVNKPVDLDDFFSAIWSIEQFWFGSARLPEESK